MAVRTDAGLRRTDEAGKAPGGEMGKVRAAKAMKWRVSAAALCAAGAGIATLLATGTSVAASNTSDPAINSFAVSPPGSDANNQAVVRDLITGPDGALWFTWTINTVNGLGRVTTAGHVSTFPAAPSGWFLEGLTAGDGSLWTTEVHGGAQYIGQWSTSGALIHEFPGTSRDEGGITWGPDGALWFVGGTSGDPSGWMGGFIGRMTTAGATTTYPLPPSSNGYNAANDIVVGPDGDLWFDLPSQAAVGRMTLSGVVKEFPLPGAEWGSTNIADHDLAVGSDGAMWVCAYWSGGIRRVTTGGAVTTFPVQYPTTITGGPDGNLWYVDHGVVNRMSTAGTITARDPLPSGFPAGVITSGPDGKLWVGVEAAVLQLDPKAVSLILVPNVTPGSGAGSLSPTPSNVVATQTPTPTGTPSPVVPGVVSPATPSDASGGGVAVAAHVPSSTGPNLGLIIGPLAAVVVVATAAVFIVRRRRRAGSNV
jgi:virginiamycin B lyase